LFDSELCHEHYSGKLQSLEGGREGYYELVSLDNEIVIGRSWIPGSVCNRQLVKGEIIYSL
jgi:hypothetical protein